MALTISTYIINKINKLIDKKCVISWFCTLILLSIIVYDCGVFNISSTVRFKDISHYLIVQKSAFLSLF